jgi:hypothetical protein
MEAGHPSLYPVALGQKFGPAEEKKSAFVLIVKIDSSTAQALFDK